MNLENFNEEMLDDLLFQEDFDPTTKIFNGQRLELDECITNIKRSLKTYDEQKFERSNPDRTYLILLHESIRLLLFDYKEFHETVECEEVFSLLEKYTAERSGLARFKEIHDLRDREVPTAPHHFADLIEEQFLVPFFSERKRNQWSIESVASLISIQLRNHGKIHNILNFENRPPKVLKPSYENLLWICDDGEVEVLNLGGVNGDAQFEYCYWFDFVISIETRFRTNYCHRTKMIMPSPFLLKDPSDVCWWDLRDKSPLEKASIIVNDDWKKLKISGKCKVLNEMKLLFELMQKYKEASSSEDVTTDELYETLSNFGMSEGATYESYVDSLRKDTTISFPGRKSIFKTSCDGKFISFNPSIKFAIHEIRGKL